MVLPVYYALQGHPESGKQWMTMIDNILIKKCDLKLLLMIGAFIFVSHRTGKQNICFNKVTISLLACDLEKTGKYIFDAIGKVIQLDDEQENGIVPFEFLVVKDYNEVDIKQTPHYIKMGCANYIQRFLKLHGWETDLLKPLSPEMILTSASSTLNCSSATLNASKYNDTPRVSKSNESFEKASDLKNSKMVRKNVTHTDHPGGTYGPKNNQDGIDNFSVRSSEIPEQKMKCLTSQQGSENNTGPSTNQTRDPTMNHSCSDTHDCDSV